MNIISVGGINMKKEKIILAYSGGLDTTVIIPWLQENYNYDVVAVCVNVGQESELINLEAKALASGACKVYVKNVVEEFITDYIFPTLKAQAIYENNYLLGTSMARPLISKVLVDIAKKENAVAICHGATGKGNDQVRFELGIKALAPDLKIIAPWRIWDLQSREDEIAFLEKRNLPIPMKKEESYSRDFNIWHMSHEGLELEDVTLKPEYNSLLKLTNTLANTPDDGEKVVITFVKGIPVALNHKECSATELMNILNDLGGKHGIGIKDIVENRVVGMKSRGVYETPGGTILYKAHQQLEQLCLDRQTMSFKNIVSHKFAELVYDGMWFCDLRKSLSAFIDSTQEKVSGDVTVELYKGNIIPSGTTSPYSLYDEDLASFETGELYNHKDAEGFINLFGLPLKIQGMINAGKNNDEKLLEA